MCVSDFHFCAHCTEKCTGASPAERVAQGKVGWVTHRVTCTWWLLWLSVEMPWLALGGTDLALFAQMGLETATLTLHF